MPRSPLTNGPVRALIVMASLTLVVVALYFAKTVLVPIVLAVLFTFLLTPPVQFLERRKVPRVAAIALVMAVTVVLVGGATALVGWELRVLAEEMPEHKKEILAKIDELGGAGSGGWV